jgi:hypothetical protein
MLVVVEAFLMEQPFYGDSLRVKFDAGLVPCGARAIDHVGDGSAWLSLSASLAEFDDVRAYDRIGQRVPLKRSGILIGPHSRTSHTPSQCQ